MKINSSQLTKNILEVYSDKKLYNHQYVYYKKGQIQQMTHTTYRGKKIIMFKDGVFTKTGRHGYKRVPFAEIVYHAKKSWNSPEYTDTQIKTLENIITYMKYQKKADIQKWGRGAFIRNFFSRMQNLVQFHEFKTSVEMANNLIKKMEKRLNLENTLIMPEENPLKNSFVKELVRESEIKPEYNKVKKDELNDAKPGDYVLESFDIKTTHLVNSESLSQKDEVKKMTIKISEKEVIDSYKKTDESKQDLLVLLSTKSDGKYYLVHLNKTGSYEKVEEIVLSRFITEVRLRKSGLKNVKDDGYFEAYEEDGSESKYRINDSGHIETFNDDKI